jgi:dipeptidyl aminopeptidase/acylaminoacyl peptidase
LPLLLDLHPGPHAAFGFTFSLLAQILAGRGFGVVYGNPRGSLGYGNAFSTALTGAWGSRDVDDALAIVGAAVARGGFDAGRTGVMGTSYGGFLTTWLLGHTARFRSGVSADAVNDFSALFTTSDVGWFLASELDTDPHRDAGRVLFERSALRGAAAIEAPLLIVHSERDYRVPIDQAEQLFNVLRFLGKENVEFIRLDGDGHELSRSGRPRQRVLRMRAIVHWFERTLAGKGPSTEAGALFYALAGEEMLDAPPARI